MCRNQFDKQLIETGLPLGVGFRHAMAANLWHAMVHGNQPPYRRLCAAPGGLCNIEQFRKGQFGILPAREKVFDMSNNAQDVR